MQVRSRARALLLVLGALAGFAGTGFATGRVEGGIGFSDALMMRPLSAGAGAISGALVGFLVWTLLDPRRRISRLAIVLTALNCGAWSLYLVCHPRISDGEDPRFLLRAEFDVQAALGSWGGMHGIGHTVSHPPMLLAGRPFTLIALSEKPLGLMAAPAVAFVTTQTVPERYSQTGPTIRESYWIAFISFFLSTA
jgi:hypothetical protein